MEELTPGNPPEVEYINLLIRGMVKSNTLSLTIKMSEPLPEVSPLDGDAPSSTFTDAINRLKVMSGLKPVEHEEPVDGVIRMFVKSVPHQVKTHFEDNRDDPWCRIDIIKDDS